MKRARKIIRIMKISRILEKDECIETWINGHYETQNFANKGDYVITGTQGEEYAIDPKTVERRYLILENNTLQSKPVEIDFKYAKEDISFKASWGDDIYMKKGDVLVYENNKLSYGIMLHAFNETYEVINDERL